MDFDGEIDWQECECGRGNFDANRFNECFTCHEEGMEQCEECGELFRNPKGHETCFDCARKDLKQCKCGKWHSKEYPQCFTCAQKTWQSKHAMKRRHGGIKEVEAFPAQSNDEPDIPF